MSDYIKLFNTKSEQDAFLSSPDYIQPHVSCTANGKNIRYNKYDDEYLLNTPFTIEATEDGTTVYFRKSDYAGNEDLDSLKIEVSTDNGITWEEFMSDMVPGMVIAQLDEGDKVLIRGNNDAYGYYSEEADDIVENSNFWADKPCYVYGNIMSLIGGDSFSQLNSVQDYAFAYFFSDYDSSIDHSWVLFKNWEKLVLPATTLAQNCYQSMFEGCTRIISAPDLPATTLAESCYVNMFSMCSNLIVAPNLPAVILAHCCYDSMFSGCTSLIAAPDLPATTLAPSCYSSMFYGCTSLTTAPDLPATTLVNRGYAAMFNGCTGLTTAPNLPATTLADGCYYHMFAGCTNLTKAPVLPATTLVQDCYSYMFSSCTKLDYIKAMFTTTPSSSYTSNWVNRVASTGTFVKNASANWTTTGNNGIPTGWTVVLENNT